MGRDSEKTGKRAAGPWLDRNRWLLFLITLILFTPFAFLSVDLHHAGVMLKPAMDVADGMVIFRDSFNQYGFLTSFIQAAAVKLFGGEVLVINLLTVVFYGLCAVELDRFWSRFLSTPFRWLMMGLFWGMAPFYLVPMHPWSSVYALYFMLLGGTLMVRYLDSGSLRLIRFLDLPGQEFGLRRFRLSPVPEGPADLEIRSAGLTETFNYPGEEREFFIHVRNHGGTAATGLTVARLAFPPGVTVLSGGAGEKFPDVPPCGFATHTVKVKAGRPLKGVFRLQLSGAGAPREAFRGPVEFDRNPQLPKAGYVPEPRPVNTRYEIGAFYFPGWETGKRWNQIRTAAPERKPLLGYYDETSPEVIDWQIKWLVENGFSFLLVDWYWNRGSRSHEHWVKAFDRARYNKYLKWAVMWANHTPPGSHSVEDQRAVTRYWIDNYFNKPYYYRIDGRPVVVIWQPGNMRRDLGPHGTHKLLHISQEMAKEAGLPGICFIAMKWPEAAVDAQAVETLKADGFSMTSIYHYMGTGDRTPANPARYDFSLVAESSPEFWNRNHKAGVLPFLPNLSTGWNDFPWHFYGGTAVENRTPELFREICRDARRFADRTGIWRLVLAPLNEWGEGSYAEPNREYKFKMYEAVRDAFATPPSGGWPLNYGPEAVGLGPYPLDPAAP